MSKDKEVRWGICSSCKNKLAEKELGKQTKRSS